MKGPGVRGLKGDLWERGPLTDQEHTSYGLRSAITQLYCGFFLRNQTSLPTATGAASLLL